MARILELLPQTGLIIDVRGNGGGIIAAGELMLQLLSPRTIEPEHLHFINTPLTFDPRPTRPPGSRPAPVDGEAVETGAPFSDGLPLAGTDTGRRATRSVSATSDRSC